LTPNFHCFRIAFGKPARVLFVFLFVFVSWCCFPAEKCLHQGEVFENSVGNLNKEFLDGNAIEMLIGNSDKVENHDSIKATPLLKPEIEGLTPGLQHIIDEVEPSGYDEAIILKDAEEPGAEPTFSVEDASFLDIVDDVLNMEKPGNASDSLKPELFDSDKESEMGDQIGF